MSEAGKSNLPPEVEAARALSKSAARKLVPIIRDMASEVEDWDPEFRMKVLIALGRMTNKFIDKLRRDKNADNPEAAAAMIATQIASYVASEPSAPKETEAFTA